LQAEVAAKGESVVAKPIVVTNRTGEVVAEGSKTIYAASKEHYRAKRCRIAQTASE
jgi:hypothetical protein